MSAAPPTEWETIPLRELDRLCAIHALGWKATTVTFTTERRLRSGTVRRPASMDVWVDPAGATHHDVPYFSATLTAAERVMRAMSAEGYLWQLNELVTGWVATVTLPGARSAASAATLAQAICVAALKAKGVALADVTSLGAAA